MSKIDAGKIVLPKESYEIMGAAFRVFNQLGWGFLEKQYQKALAKELELLKIHFKREVAIPLTYKSMAIGNYFADFIVENKIILELKVVHTLGYANVKQLLGYLKSSGMKLGILIYFTREGVKYRRVLNSEV